MFGRKRKIAWWRIALISLIVIAMGAVMGKVVDRQIFAKNFGRSAAFIESVRQNRPEGIGAEEWNASIDITVTAFCNVCTYDPKNDKSKRMISKILALRKSPQDDPLGKPCKIWELLYYRCSPREKNIWIAITQRSFEFRVHEFLEYRLAKQAAGLFTDPWIL